jgi:hypothetical protein
MRSRRAALAGFYQFRSTHDSNAAIQGRIAEPSPDRVSGDRSRWLNQQQHDGKIIDLRVRIGAALANWFFDLIAGAVFGLAWAQVQADAARRKGRASRR